MSEFKNEPVSEIIDWLEENRDEFTRRRSGQAWKAIALAVANTFKEDRPAIYASLTGPAPRRKPVETGGARVTRLTPEPGTQVRTGGCEDCGDSGAVVTAVKQPRVIVVGKKKTGEPLADDPGVNHVDDATADGDQGEPAFTSPEDVFSRFSGDGEMMIAYAKQNAIDVGRASKPETLAERIYNHYAGE